MEIFPTSEATFLLPAPSGFLEVLTSPPKENVEPKNSIAIICHPHPLYSGTMHNKVVTTLKRVYSDLGMKTVRFNFRGVGKSSGEFANGVGELEDLMTVIKWAQQVCPQDEICLAGFSFGSYIAACAADIFPTKSLVCIAPPVERFDFAKLNHISCPWIVVQGDQDDVVTPSEVYRWIDSLKLKPQLIRIPDASHFFHGKLLELRNELETALKQ